MEHKNVKHLINNFACIRSFCFAVVPKKGEDSFDACFRKAWNDCGQGYRYLKNAFIDNKDIVRTTLKGYLKNNHIKFSTKLIDKVAKIFDFSTDKYGRSEFGAAQKIVNMLFKYLFLCQDFTNIKITNLSDLHCPLDSIILSWVDGYECKKWTHVNEYTYESIQNKITEIIKRNQNCELFNLSKECGNLAFDFFHWPNKRNDK